MGISRFKNKVIVEELREPIKVKENKNINRYSRAKRGKREDLFYYDYDGIKQNYFFRSSWEANYARYLNLLVERNLIQHWEYEFIKFRFEPNPENKLKKGIQSGTMSYLPDFMVILNDEIEFHEVKGYLCPRNKTQFRRLKKYHPEIKLIIIGLKEYNEITRVESKNIVEWEGKRIK